jgi:hypothetical protein
MIQSPTESIPGLEFVSDARGTVGVQSFKLFLSVVSVLGMFNDSLPKMVHDYQFTKPEEIQTPLTENGKFRIPLQYLTWVIALIDLFY